MAKDTSILRIFNLQELADLAHVDYYRIYHVSRGKRKTGFQEEEIRRLSKTILVEVNKALEGIQSKNRVTSAE